MSKVRWGGWPANEGTEEHEIERRQAAALAHADHLARQRTHARLVGCGRLLGGETRHAVHVRGGDAAGLDEGRGAVEALAGGVTLCAFVSEEDVHLGEVDGACQLCQRRHRRAGADAHRKGALGRDGRCRQRRDAALDEAGNGSIILQYVGDASVGQDEAAELDEQWEHISEQAGRRRRAASRWQRAEGSKHQRGSEQPDQRPVGPVVSQPKQTKQYVCAVS